MTFIYKQGLGVTAYDSIEVLEKILDIVRTRDAINTRNWFEELQVLKFDGGVLQVGCPDKAKAQFLQDNCLSTFSLAAQSVTGHLVTVEFAAVSNYKQNTKPDRPEHQETFRLHPDYTFDSFVIGPSNRLAHASCVAVSHSPGDTYNPLFLHGSVGLGKTHLQHAICHEALKKNPDTQITFLSCEQFINQFIGAIEKGKLTDFQKNCRSADILVIDDIQFLRERERSQEEFFHTFNSLYNDRKQIVLTADCAPSDLPALEERLISRFKWGLVARLDAPTYETRIAIVKKKADLRGLKISEEIAEYIARKVKANIRELEGALTTIYAMSRSGDKKIDIALAKQALGNGEEQPQKNISITEIIDAVTEYFDVKLTDLLSKKRNQSIILPRQCCMYLARNLTRHSLEEIGGHLGGRDHTTVLHACTKIAQMEKEDHNIKTQLKELTASITQE